MSETTHGYKTPPQSKRHELAEQLALVGDKTRIEIICQLFMSEKAICVSEIAESMEISVANASYHLNLLADAELCDRKRKDKRICYSTKDTEFMKNLKYLLCDR
jgi:DNA-binding transcriptional ArsR family regulator